MQRAATALWAPLVVCHQLRSHENLGAIARVMANFGASKLVLSDPLTHDFRGAEQLAVGAEGIVRAVAVARSLDEALSKCVFAVGSSSRSEVPRAKALSPEEGAALLAEHSARGPVALVLGGEKRGLSNDELSRCQAMVVIPTHDAQPSMNVASAAAVLLYACARARVQAVQTVEEGAPLALVQRLEARAREVLLRAEFLNPQAPDHVLRELMRSLVKGKLTLREAELWLGAFEQLGRMGRSH
jgi:tRNA/rRNA methyltransferase